VEVRRGEDVGDVEDRLVVDKDRGDDCFLSLGAVGEEALLGGVGGVGDAKGQGQPRGVMA
jgi:hypothetical protein